MDDQTAARAAASRRRRRAREVPLPGVRRRRELESGQAGAGLPVLRDRVAGRASRARRGDGRSSNTIFSPRSAACLTSAAVGRPRRRRSAARAAAPSRSSTPARSAAAASSAVRRSSCRTKRPRTRSGPNRCCRSRSSEPNARELIRRWYGRQWLAPNALGKRRRSPTRSRGSICRTGRSTRRRTRGGRPNPARTTTRGSGKKPSASRALAPGGRRAVARVRR